MIVMNYTRREFNRLSALAGIACFGGMNQHTDELAHVECTQSFYDFRQETEIPHAVKLLGDLDFKAKDVYLKCNYNSPHPFPPPLIPNPLQLQ